MKKYQGAFIKNEREIACLREANRMVANILDAIGDIVKPGETTMRFEELARDMCADYKVKPAFLGYYGYPYATCCSVNEQVVHGFPSPRLLEEGDIVSVVYDGLTIAKGISNYSSVNINAIKGLQSADIPKVLGHNGIYEEVIHRDNLVAMY